MTDEILYSRKGCDFKSVVIDQLYYLKATGERIEVKDGDEYGGGLQDLIDRGVIVKHNKPVALNAEMVAELKENNVVFPKGIPTLVGERKWSKSKPTLAAISVEM